MKELHALIAALVEKLGTKNHSLEVAQNRYLANRKRAYKAHGQAEAATVAADKFRAAGHAAKAARKDAKAQRLHAVAYKNHTRAQWWLARIKTIQQRINNLENTEARLEAELRALRGTVTIKGDTATGGSPRERLKAVALASAAACASGSRPNFYSQVGAFDADHAITGPAYSHRDDCSSWFASVYKSAGLPDPSAQNFAGGYTGTLVANGKEVGTPQPGDAVIYGSGVGHHVEMYIGPGDKTIGHGSAPVDAGVINLFGDGDYRFFTFL
jgi:cell wall-associated NlpC family hydrolase